MNAPEADFLPRVIGILDRLHVTTAEHGEATLSLLIDLARTEAEDVLRQAGLEADLKTRREQTSSVSTWRQGGEPIQLREASEARNAAPRARPAAAAERRARRAG